jgi:CIC family chloride channel protein
MSYPAWLTRATGRTPRLMVLAALVGIGAGLGAVVLIRSLEWVGSGTQWVIDNVSIGEFALLALLPLGIWISWRLGAWFAPEVAGHGVPQIVAAITVRGGQIRARVMALKTVATALTIGAGGSAGREGSIAQIGSSIGSWLARVARLGENDMIVLVAAGAGAGISATFNAPIAGMFFAMEVILRQFSLRHLHTIIVASVAGAVVAHSIIGEALTFNVTAYALDDPRLLILYGVLGLVVVPFAWLFLVSLDWFDIRGKGLPVWVRPIIFALFVAALGLIHNEILGTGQAFVNEVLRDEVNLAWWTLGLLAALKALATGATLGGRGAGGIFMPSLFMGATAGSGFAHLVAGSFSAVSPGAFGLVGMAASFAAVARAPLTSILIVFEITGDYGLVLPLMIATAISTFLAGRVKAESAYSAPLVRMGIHPTHGGVTDLLDTVVVGDTMHRNPVIVSPTDTLGHVQGVMQRNRTHGLPVVDHGDLMGVVTETDILRIGGPSDQVTAGEAMTPNPVTVSPQTPVSDALERMAALGVGRLPIVAEEDSTRLVGIFKREDVVRAYHRALGVTAQAESQSDRLKARTRAAALPGYSDLQVPIGSVADGRQVSEIPWPEGCLLVTVHRGSQALIPTGRTVIKAGDTITVFAGEVSRKRLVERLNRTTDAESEAAEDSQPSA